MMGFKVLVSCIYWSILQRFLSRISTPYPRALTPYPRALAPCLRAKKGVIVKSEMTV